MEINMNNSTKQILIVRKDLNMRKGKIAAQCCHASMGVLLKDIYWSINSGGFVPMRNHPEDFFVRTDSAVKHWLENSFVKICVYVNSESELLELEKTANEMGIKNYLITDNGKTEFNGIPTKTVLAIGPDWSDKIDQITGNLPLL